MPVGACKVRFLGKANRIFRRIMSRPGGKAGLQMLLAAKQLVGCWGLQVFFVCLFMEGRPHHVAPCRAREVRGRLLDALQMHASTGCLLQLASEVPQPARSASSCMSPSFLTPTPCPFPCHPQKRAVSCIPAAAHLSSLLLQFILPTCTTPLCLFPCHPQKRAASYTPAGRRPSPPSAPRAARRQGRRRLERRLSLRRRTRRWGIWGRAGMRHLAARCSWTPSRRWVCKIPSQ